MCVPVVKSRWRVRHWSAPDRLLATSSPDDPHTLNTTEEPSMVEGLTSSSGVIVEQSDMVRDPFAFLTDIEDPMDEITSPITSVVVPCKGDDWSHFSSSPFTHPTLKDQTRLKEPSTSIDDESTNPRSQVTFCNEEMIKDDKEDTEDTIENLDSRNDSNIEAAWGAIHRARRRHASCPCSLENDCKMSSIIQDICKRAQSQPLSPAQSMVLMLLLQRRQNSQQISPDLNTARRKISTARTKTFLDRSTVRALRHHRQLRKLKVMHPQYGKGCTSCNPRICHDQRRSLTNCLSTTHFTMAYGIQVPDSIKVNDLYNYPFRNMQQPNLHCAKCNDEDVNEKPDVYQNLESLSSSELYVNNSQSISSTYTNPLIGQHCIRPQSVIKGQPDEKELVLKHCFDEPLECVNRQQLHNINNIMRHKNGTKVRIESAPVVRGQAQRCSVMMIDNLILLLRQSCVSELLSNNLSCYYSSSVSPTTHSNDDGERCLNTTATTITTCYGDNINKTLFESTSSKSNLTSNVEDWNRKNNNEEIVTTTRLGNETTMSISESLQSNDCQNTVPVKPEEKEFDITQSKVIQDVYFKETYSFPNLAKIDPSTTLDNSPAPHHESYSTSRTKTSCPILPFQTDKNVVHDKKLASSGISKTTCRTARNATSRTKLLTQGYNKSWLNPIIVSLMMLMMTVLVTCAQEKGPSK